jgi:hypothetical protein
MNLCLRPSLFWDTDIQSIDLEKNKSVIIQRIFTRGSLEEFFQVMEFYGKENCKETMLKTRWMDAKTLSFCSIIFDTPINLFRCFQLVESNKDHLNFE